MKKYGALRLIFAEECSHSPAVCCSGLPVIRNKFDFAATDVCATADRHGWRFIAETLGFFINFRIKGSATSFEHAIFCGKERKKRGVALWRGAKQQVSDSSKRSCSETHATILCTPTQVLRLHVQVCSQAQEVTYVASGESRHAVSCRVPSWVDSPATGIRS